MKYKKKIFLCVLLLFNVLGLFGCSVPSANNLSNNSTQPEQKHEISSEHISVATVTEGIVLSNQSVGTLAVHFLDVGQGLSVLIESDGHYMLYDGGDRDKSSYVVSYLKKEGVETLDYVIASHYDADHLNGVIGAINVFNIDKVIGPDYIHDSKLYQSFTSTIQSKGIAIEYPVVGTEYTFGMAKFVILSPKQITPDSNNNSVAIKIINGENSFILTGDAEYKSEIDMCNSGIDLSCTVLCVGHHGSASSTTWDFLQQTVPEYAIISCGSGNSYGHPHAETMEKLESMEIDIFRTDKQGAIIATSNGAVISWNMEPCNDYSPGDSFDTETQAMNQESSTVPDSGQYESIPVQTTVYWVLNGKVYHSTPDCSTLSNSQTIHSGSVDEANVNGKARGCKSCY